MLYLLLDSLTVHLYRQASKARDDPLRRLMGEDSRCS